jgi:hypothetical protein
MSPALGMRLRHGMAAAAGLAIFALIFVYTGDADLWTALGCGIATALIFYFSAHLRDANVSDGSD